MKIEDLIILSIAGVAVFMIMKSRQSAPATVSAGAGQSTAASYSNAAGILNNWGMNVVTDVEGPIFRAANMPGNPTMQQQMDYYYSMGM